MLESILSTLLGGLLTLCGVMLSNRMTRKNEQRREHKRLLMESYARILSCYTRLLAAPTSLSARESLLAAIDQTRLICSDENMKILDDLIPVVAKDHHDAKQSGKIMTRLRSAARAELSDT